MIFYVLPLRGVRESRDFSRVEVSKEQEKKESQSEPGSD